MSPPAKPRPSAEALHSDAAEKADGIAVEGWGDGMYRQIIRLCVYEKTRGMKIECPKPPT